MFSTALASSYLFLYLDLFLLKELIVPCVTLHNTLNMFKKYLHTYFCFLGRLFVCENVMLVIQEILSLSLVINIEDESPLSHMRFAWNNDKIPLPPNPNIL